MLDQQSSPWQSAMHNRQRRYGVTDLNNALGGSYNHPQHGSRPRVSDQQPFAYITPCPKKGPKKPYEIFLLLLS
jgi:hypothetical protein